MFITTIAQKLKLLLHLICLNTYLNLLKYLMHLMHDALEHYLMNKYYYKYKDAHKIVERKYDYLRYIE